MSIKNLITNLFFYYAQTFKRRKMIQAIALGYRKKGDIAWYARCSEKAVYNFFEDARRGDDGKHIIHQFLTVTLSTNPITGRDEANKLYLNEDFRKALKWAEKFGYLNSPNRKKNKILNHAKEWEEKHDSSIQNEPKLPPSFTKTSLPLKDSYKDLTLDTIKRNVSVHPLLKKIEIDHGAELFAMRSATEREIFETVRTCKYQFNANKVSNPSAYFIGTLKKNINKYRGIIL
jgi:hypothetical protein